MKIVVEQRSEDWMAYIYGEKHYSDCGASPQAAIGNLILSHPGKFCLELKVIDNARGHRQSRRTDNCVNVRTIEQSQQERLQV